MSIAHSKPLISNQDLEAVKSNLLSGFITQGKTVEEFESRVCEYVEYNYGLAFNSGTSALIVALKALEVGKGNEVILPTYVCKSVIEAVISVSAEPILVDITKDWTYCFENICSKISEKTKVIIVVNIFGIINDLTPLINKGIWIIDDSCQTFFPVKYKGEKLLSIYSFHATKCLTTGEGGMCCTNNIEIFSKLVEIRDGLANKYVNNRLSFVLTDMQASLGISQLKSYHSFLEKRKMIANEYFNRVNFSNNCLFSIPKTQESIFYRFPIQIHSEIVIDDVIAWFDKQGIQVRRGVDMLLHRIMGLDDDLFPNAVYCFNHTLSLPIYPALSLSEQEIIIEKLNIFILEYLQVNEN